MIQDQIESISEKKIKAYELILTALYNECKEYKKDFTDEVDKLIQANTRDVNFILQAEARVRG
jgi:hypothetical protein